MTIHRLDEVLEAMPPKPRTIGLPAQTGADPAYDPTGRGPVPAVKGIRFIPRLCSCTWAPRFSTVPATWTRTEADPACELHWTAEEAGAGR